jgi:uncharacterized membrane protein YphA (DoxX/SURF4 family)
MSSILKDRDIRRKFARLAAAGAELRSSAAARPGAFISRRRREGVAVLRILFGVIWAVDATLKWLPSFGRRTLVDTLQEAAQAQPAPFRGWADEWARVVVADPSLFAVIVAVAETLLAVALLGGVFTNAVCVLGAAFSFAVWGAGEAFGGPYGPGATDVGASIVYVIVFGLLWMADAGGVWGGDAWLRPRLGKLGSLASAGD